MEIIASFVAAIKTPSSSTKWIIDTWRIRSAPDASFIYSQMHIIYVSCSRPSEQVYFPLT